ncbi:MAG TPA: helix-turn-helix domain-containing protein [Roseiflexaceae bacterium]|nr:helix-turn-helix domain-containing protein [Roseiflexaceae bacterium]
MATVGTNIQPEIIGDDWLTLQDASEMLGVATSTLRRWGDAGRVPMKRTLGGHRRFARDVIARLASGQAPRAEMVPASQPAPRQWGINSHEMERQEWHARLAARPGADKMRGLGQRLLGLLIQYINRREDDRRFLNEARVVGSNYGREAREAQVSMHDTVEAFLFFRSSFSEVAMPLPGIAQPTDLAEAAALHARLNRFMDAILLGVIAGYESA